MNRRHRITAALALVALTAACAGGSAPAPAGSPAPTHTDSLGQTVISMSDSFPDVVTTCDHGNRIYQSFNVLNGNGGTSVTLAVVKADPTCPTTRQAK